MKAPAVVTEIARFAWRHRGHAPALLLLPFAGILVHEGSHALAALAFGADVIDMQLWPGEGRWGQVRTHWPAEVRTPLRLLIFSLAPYLLDVTVVSGVCLVAWRKRAFSFAAASCLLLYGFCAPLADVANVARNWLIQRSRCDLEAAFGDAGPIGYASFALLLPIVLLTGHALQKRLYGERALSVPAYSTLAALAMLVLVAALPAWNALLTAIGPYAQ